MRRTTDMKICGITRPADVRLAQQAGASHFGTIVEIPRSPRSVSVATAIALREETRLPQVCVMESTDPAQVEAVIHRVRPAALQLHGCTDAGCAHDLRAVMPPEVELWLAVGLPAAASQCTTSAAALTSSIAEYATAGVARIVLDTLSGGHTGGTGQTSDWTLAAKMVAVSPLPIMLAGGISPENVTEAVRSVKPAGIDVSSGVEQTPGVKDEARLMLLAARFREVVAEQRRH